jgi:tetratricopeptide (TPR) repeat protein
MRYSSFIGILAGLGLVFGLCLGQKTTTGGTTSGSKTTSRSESNTSSPLGQGGPFQQERRAIFLSGKVLMQDGAPPPEHVVIERVCNGVARPEGYADSKGRFSIQLGRQSAVFSDASVSESADRAFGGMNSQTNAAGSSGGLAGGISERDLMGCEIRAALPGYQSSAVSLSGRKLLDDPNIGTIILHRLANVDGSTVSFTSMKAPKDARKAYEKGIGAIRKQKWPDAQSQMEKAVQVYPEYAEAWLGLGFALDRQNQPAQARESYNKAIAADPKFIKPYLHLSEIAAREQKWQEVVEVTERIVKLDPVDFPAAHFYNAVANFNLNNLDAAEKSAKEACALDKQHRLPKIEHLLGVILARRGDFVNAAQHMKSYLTLAPNARDAETVKKQMAEMEKSALLKTRTE